MLSKLDIFNFHKSINNGDIDVVKLIVKKTPEIINAKTYSYDEA